MLTDMPLALTKAKALVKNPTTSVSQGAADIYIHIATMSPGSINEEENQ